MPRKKLIWSKGIRPGKRFGTARRATARRASEVMLHLTNGEHVKVEMSEPDLGAFVGWMDLNQPDHGPMMLGGVLYQRSEIEAFSMVGKA